MAPSARRSTLIGLVLALLCAWSSRAVALTPDEAKQVVLDFYRTAFVEHDPVAAARKHIGATYIQHNSRVPNGAAAFVEFFDGYFRRNPGASSTLVRVIADGDLVALHTHARTNPDDRGRAIIDIFRVEGGKIVEHWDVIQDVPEKSANGNTMFDGNNAR